MPAAGAPRPVAVDDNQLPGTEDWVRTKDKAGVIKMSSGLPSVPRTNKKKCTFFSFLLFLPSLWLRLYSMTAVPLW